QVQTGLPRPVWQPGGRTGFLPAVLRLVQQRALPHGSGPADTAPGPLRPRRGGDRKAQPSARGGVRSASGTFRPEAADGGRAGCRGLDQPADSRDHRISTLNYDFSCLKGVDTFRVLGVAPHAGAWIETSLDGVSAASRPVAPHAGAWIETRIKLTQSTL